MKDKSRRNGPRPCGSGKKHRQRRRGKGSLKPSSTTARPQEPPPVRANFEDEDQSQLESEPSGRPRDEWDDWQDRYDVASPKSKVKMLRALLAENHPPDFYADLGFRSLVLHLRHDLGRGDGETCTAFLEDMLASRPDVFKLGMDWYVREMAYVYVNSGREHDIARPLACLLDESHSPDEPVFDLRDLLGLAGRYEESRSLSFAMLKQSEHAGFMPWAVDELAELAAFFLYQDAIEAGGTAKALGELQKRLAQIECNPSKTNLKAMLAHRAGTADRRIELQDLLGQGESTGFNRYLLSLDFGRWLTTEREMSPIVADTMRHFVYVCLGHMWEDNNDPNPLVLYQDRLDGYLAGLLDFMSLMHLRGVATLIAMFHFFDFLAATNLVNKPDRRRAHRICNDLWLQMDQILGDEAADYAFLHRYL